VVLVVVLEVLVVVASLVQAQMEAILSIRTSMAR
jgi:hypothetical protein